MKGQQICIGEFMEIEKYFTGPKIVFFGAHFDDVEFGCGALIYRLCKFMKENVYIAVFSAQNKNAKGEVQLKRNEVELRDSLNHLGVLSGNIFLGDLSGQIFDSSQQAIREYLLKVRRDINPSFVFYPSKSDIHQDHQSLANESYRIFRNENCFGYEIIRSSLQFLPNFYIKINKEEIERKAEAVLKYCSQKHESAGYYFSEEAIFSLSQYRGTQIGVQYAEAFECYKAVLKE